MKEPWSPPAHSTERRPTVSISSELFQPYRLLSQRVLTLVAATIGTVTAITPVNTVYILQHKTIRTRGTGCNDTDIAVCTEAVLSSYHLTKS